jgi:DNA polymerase-3 subunit delta'
MLQDIFSSHSSAHSPKALQARWGALLAQEKMPQVQLLASGSASTPLALGHWLAATLLCPHPLLTGSCQQCRICRNVKILSHPDLHVIFPIGPTATLKGKDVTCSRLLSQFAPFVQRHATPTLQDWALALKSDGKRLQIPKEEAHRVEKYALFNPYEGKRKVILLWLPELFTPAAANALLKRLEDPPPYLFFILISGDLQRILPTIASRATLVRTTLPPLQEEKSSSAHTAAFASWFRALYQRNWLEIVTHAEKFHSSNFATQMSFMAHVLKMLQHTLHHQVGTPYMDMGSTEETLAQRMSTTFSPQKLTQLTEAITHLHQVIAANAYVKLAFLHTSSRLIRAMHSA